MTGVPRGGFMASPAPSVLTMPRAGHSDHFPATPRPAPAAAEGDSRLRPLEVAECPLCSAARPLGLLVPDGGGACADVRWYCKDVKSCTERWTSARSR